MEAMIAFCGLDCGSCPIHLATLEQDSILQYAARESIAEQLSLYYGIKKSPDEVNDCEGCKATSDRLFSGCLQCNIRKCALEKHLESCAFCDSYSCDKLMNHFSLDPGARERLEKIRNTSGNNYFEVKE